MARTQREEDASGLADILLSYSTWQLTHFEIRYLPVGYSTIFDWLIFRVASIRKYIMTTIKITHINIYIHFRSCFLLSSPRFDFPSRWFSKPHILSTTIISISLSLHLVLLVPINSCSLHIILY